MAEANSSGLEWLSTQKCVSMALSHHSNRGKLEGRDFDLSWAVRTHTPFLTHPSLGL